MFIMDSIVNKSNHTELCHPPLVVRGIVQLGKHYSQNENIWMGWYYYHIMVNLIKQQIPGGDLQIVNCTK